MWNRTENQVTLVLVRHGMTQANVERRYLGKTDESLSESGRKQLMEYKMQHLYPQVQYLFISPMKRCLETAQIIYPDLHPIAIDEWTEIDFGQFEYKNYEELKDNAQYQAWVDSGGTLAFPEGESRDSFIRRCEKGWTTMCTILDQISCHQVPQYSDSMEPASVGVIVHGGTIMALLSTYGEKQYFDCQAANGGGYICHLSGWRNTSHIHIKEAVPL